MFNVGKIPPAEKHGELRPIHKMIHDETGRLQIIFKVEPFHKRVREEEEEEEGDEEF